MTELVLDCSVAMAWCFEDECDAYADGVLGALLDGRAVVPSIWLLEVVNVLLLAERRHRIERSQATRFLEVLKGLPLSVEDLPLARAFHEVHAVARDSGLTAYDATYLELAMRSGLPVATRDGALRAACQRAGVVLFQPP